MGLRGVRNNCVIALAFAVLILNTMSVEAQPKSEDPGKTGLSGATTTNSTTNSIDDRSYPAAAVSTAVALSARPCVKERDLTSAKSLATALYIALHSPSTPNSTQSQAPEDLLRGLSEPMKSLLEIYTSGQTFQSFVNGLSDSTRRMLEDYKPGEAPEPPLRQAFVMELNNFLVAIAEKIKELHPEFSEEFRIRLARLCVEFVLYQFVEPNPFNRLLLSQPSQAFKQLRYTLPPSQALLFSTGLRVEDASTVTTPALVYAHSPSSLDLGLQGFLGQGGGFAVALRYAYGRASFLRSLNRLSAVLNKEPSADRDENAQVVAEAYRLARETARSYVHIAMKPRVALIVGYRNFTDIGNLTQAGVSLSWLHPFRPSKPDSVSSGFLPILAVQSIRFNGTSLPDRTLTHWGIILAFQDKVPYYNAGERGIARWQWQIGFEYSRTMDFGASFGGFIRYHPPVSGDEYAASHVEYGLNFGIGPTNKFFVGFRIGTSLYLN